MGRGGGPDGAGRRADACDALAVSTALTRSGAPITELDVSWLAPGNATNSSLAGDNGSPITGYLVEWFTAEDVPARSSRSARRGRRARRPTPESGFVVQFSNGRSATTHGVTTAKLNYNAAAPRLRVGARQPRPRHGRALRPRVRRGRRARRGRARTTTTATPGP